MDVRLSPGIDSRFGLILIISLVIHLFLLVIIKINMDFDGGPAGTLEITFIPATGKTSTRMSRHPKSKNDPSRSGFENGTVLGRDIQTMIQEYFRAEDARRWKKSTQPWIFSYPPSDVFNNSGNNRRFLESSKQTVPQIQAYKTNNGNIDVKFRSQSGKMHCFVIRRPDPLNAYDEGAIYRKKC